MEPLVGHCMSLLEKLSSDNPNISEKELRNLFEKELRALIFRGARAPLLVSFRKSDSRPDLEKQAKWHGLTMEEIEHNSKTISKNVSRERKSRSPSDLLPFSTEEPGLPPAPQRGEVRMLHYHVVIEFHRNLL